MTDEPAVGAQLRLEAWAVIEDPDLTVEAAVEQLQALGTTILEVDVEGRRVKVADQTMDLPNA